MSDFTPTVENMGFWLIDPETKQLVRPRSLRHFEREMTRSWRSGAWMVARDYLPGGLMLATDFMGRDLLHWKRCLGYDGPPACFETMLLGNYELAEQLGMPCAQWVSYSWTAAERKHQQALLHVRQASVRYFDS